MRSIILPVFLGLSLTACSSDSDDSGGSASNMSSSSDANFRVSALTIEFDLSNAGTSLGNQSGLTEFEYDSAGRMETIRRSSLTSTVEPTVSTYTYGEFGIQARSDGDTTETFSYDNGRVSQIMSSDYPALSYTYDSTGKLIGVIGDAFPDGNDCDSSDSGFGGSDDETPVFETAYTGDRLDSITGSTGTVISFEYNQQGLPIRRTRDDDCGETITEYTYRADGLLLTQNTRYTDLTTETSELVATYTGDQLTQFVQTFRDEGFSDEITTTSFMYDASGRLASVTIVDELDINGDIEVDTITLTMTYEEESCVKQRTAYPDIALLDSVVGTQLQSNLNLDCNFFLDNF